LGTGVAFAVALFGYKVRPRKIQTVALIFGSVITAYLLATALIPYGDGAFMLIAPNDEATAEAVSGGRLSYWSAVWDAYRSVPFFGAGPFASFWMLEPPQPVHVQPHNIILQFLISWGIFATVAALLTLGFVTWKAHVIVYAERNGLPFLAMLDCLLAMSLVDGMTHFAQHFMLIMLCFGIIFSLTKTDEKDDPAFARSA
jgi:exopolysaccharide production protein ExoQ